MKEPLLLEATPATKPHTHSREMKTPIFNFVTESFLYLHIQHYVYCILMWRFQKITNPPDD